MVNVTWMERESEWDSGVVLTEWRGWGWEEIWKNIEMCTPN